MLHIAAKTRATFDDPNLVSHAGLVPAVRLVENVGLEDLVGEHVWVAAKVGANPGLQLVRAERLRHVVVGTGVEQCNLFRVGVAS